MLGRKKPHATIGQNPKAQAARILPAVTEHAGIIDAAISLLGLQ
jgi:hypothetical protein